MIEIVPYQPRWQAEFREVRSRLSAALGDLAHRIDHIGSTAVPGLDAKDVIDVQITLPDFSTLGEVRTQLERAGYEFRFHGIHDHSPAGWVTEPHEWEKAFFQQGQGQRRTNVHVRAAGRANQRYALLCRDYLRANPKVAEGYAALKRQLALYFDAAPYTEIKDPVVDIIMAQAAEWAERTHWTPGPDDA